MFAFGVDIGGMSVKTGLVNENGKIVDKICKKTAKNHIKVIDNIVEDIKTLLSKHNILLNQVKGIGIGCPGAINSKLGRVDLLTNLNWKNVEIVKLIEERIALKTIISNDANVATIGEAVFGSAKNFNSVVMLTVGTGIGGGVIIDKKLFEGEESKGTELGHTTLFMGGEPCACGRCGCVEQYCSATALIRQTKNAMLKNKNSKMWEIVNNDIEKVNGLTPFDAEKMGDETAHDVCETFISYLSETILNMCNIFRPNAIIIGGGISGQGKNLTNRIKIYCKKYNYGYKKAPIPKILTAKLKNDAGIIGAAALLYIE